MLNEETRRKIAITNNAQAFVTKKRAMGKSRDQRMVMAGLKVNHKWGKSLVNAFTVARMTILRRIALLERRKKRRSQQPE